MNYKQSVSNQNSIFYLFKQFYALRPGKHGAISRDTSQIITQICCDVTADEAYTEWAKIRYTLIYILYTVYLLLAHLV
jgi:hypothetical protein